MIIDGWQPIQTAPRDPGRLVDLNITTPYEGTVTRLACRYAPCEGRFAWADQHGWYVTGWHSEAEGGFVAGNDYNRGARATQWRPSVIG